jgi:hypothetical protein
MTPRKKRNALDHLRPQERADILDETLRRFPEMRTEATALAKEMLDSIDVEAMADEVHERFSAIGWEELKGRSGRQEWGGYIEPEEATWEILQEVFDPFLSDITRRYEAGLREAAEKVCQGIVLGLYRLREKDDLGALANAPDFALEAAAEGFAALLELCARSRRGTVARRFLATIGEEVEEWLEVLEQVAERAIPSAEKNKGKKRK